MTGKIRKPRRQDGVKIYIEHHPILGDIRHYVVGARRAHRKAGAQ